MTDFLFRPQRATLAEAMEEVTIVRSVADINTIIQPWQVTTIKKYPWPGAIDERIVWDTYIVLGKHGEEPVGVVGFTNGEVV